MKRLFILYLVLLIPILSACSYMNSKQESVVDIVRDSSSENIKTTEKVIRNKSKKLDLGAVDEYSLQNFPQNRFIFFTSSGRYYPVQNYGWNSANYVLCLDRGDGNTIVLAETEDSTVMYSDVDSLYLSKYIYNQNKSVKYKLEDDVLTLVDDYPFNYKKYFQKEYIYYSKAHEGIFTIYRMDKDKSNIETIIKLPENTEKYTIYENKIWYDYNDRQGVSYYDLSTGKTENFARGKIGIINNGYMYYTYYKESNALLRFNLSSYDYDVVCKATENLLAFDFCNDHIIYSSGDSIYKYNDNENTLIFSSNDFFDAEYGYEIRGIQCQDNHIYILIGSGSFYQCIMEIDIEGNIIEVIHED